MSPLFFSEDISDPLWEADAKLLGSIQVREVTDKMGFERPIVLCTNPGDEYTVACDPDGRVTYVYGNKKRCVEANKVRP